MFTSQNRKTQAKKMKNNSNTRKIHPKRGNLNMRVLKVYCPECEQTATIKKTARKHRHLADLYCACNNVECGHTFVMNMSFSHTISPSAITGDRLIHELIKLIKPDQKQLVLDILNTPPQPA